MLLMNSFRIRVAIDNKTFFAVGSVITFAPLTYMLLSVCVLNNFYAERAYYYLLRRNVILDFPNDRTTLRYFVTSFVPGLFATLPLRTQ